MLEESQETNDINRQFLFIDTETTGLYLKDNEVIEIGAIVTEGLYNIVADLELYIFPEKLQNFNRGAAELNGFYNRIHKWKKRGITKNEAVDELFKFKNEYIDNYNDMDYHLVSHNLAFEIEFLQDLINNNSSSDIRDFTTKRCFDTVSMAFQQGYNIQNLSGNDLLREFDRSAEQLPHTALKGAKKTWHIFKDLVELRKENNNDNLLISKQNDEFELNFSIKDIDKVENFMKGIKEIIEYCEQKVEEDVNNWSVYNEIAKKLYREFDILKK